MNGRIRSVGNSVAAVFAVFLVGFGCSITEQMADRDLFDNDDLGIVLQFLESRAGDDAEIRDITITPEFVEMTVVDEKSATGFMSYKYEGGQIWVQYGESKGYKSFTFGDIDLGYLGLVKTRSVSRCVYPNARVSQIVITYTPGWKDDDRISEREKSPDTLGWKVTAGVENFMIPFTFDKQGNYLRRDLSDTSLAQYNDFFERDSEIATAVGTIRKAFGGDPKLFSINVRKDSIWFTAQDPSKPEEMNEYKYHYDRVELVRAVKNSDIRRKVESMRVSYDEMFFAFDDVSDLKGLPEMSKKSVSELPIDGGKVLAVYIDRAGKVFDSNNQIEVRVSVRGDRDEGTAEFDTEGRLKKKSLN